MKKVIAASVNKRIEFDKISEFEKHIEYLESRKREYVFLSKRDLGNGRLQVDIKEQYNFNDLL